MLNVVARTGSSHLRAMEMSSMNRKSTGRGDPWEEGKRGENPDVNAPVTSGKPLAPTLNAICNDEFLLKACASRQEKPSNCHRNSAIDGT
jgi:hypothetical protein